MILADRAALFVDGRYTTQARDQVDGALFSIEHLVDTPPSAWIEANLRAGQKLGYDPWLHSAESAERLAKACAAAGAILVATEPNPIDAIWHDRPAPPHGAVVPHDLAICRRSRRATSSSACAPRSTKLKADALVVSDPPCRRLGLQHPRLRRRPHAGGARLRDRSGGGRSAPLHRRGELTDAERRRRSPALPRSGRRRRSRRTSPRSAPSIAPCSSTRRLRPHAIAQAITGHGGKAPRGADPIAVMKAVKNDTEIAGSRAAHLRDGAAVARFLAWFDRTAPSRAGSPRSTRSRRWRRSAATPTSSRTCRSRPISGSGPNGAIVHYRVTRRTNRKIAPGELYLVDSGAQYEDGTTDITRTVIVGEPTAEMRDRFTRVLKGHIAIATRACSRRARPARSSTASRGAPLWAAGLDFDHGTGHGVGSYPLGARGTAAHLQARHGAARAAA